MRRLVSSSSGPPWMMPSPSASPSMPLHPAKIIGDKYRIQDRVLDYAKQRQTPVSLKRMFDFGTWSGQASPSYSPSLPLQVLLGSALFLHQELPIRLAKRIRQLDNLPYNMLGMPSVMRVKNWYMQSFEEIASARKPRSREDQAQFTELLKNILSRHKHVVPTLAQGIIELKRSFRFPGSDPMIDNCPFLQDFLEKFYMGRLGLRILIAQHIALNNPRPGFVGIIQRECSPAKIIADAAEDARIIVEKHLGAAPRVHVSGSTGLKFRYIPEHFHHITFELLKNSMKAVVEAHHPAFKKGLKTDEVLHLMKSKIELPPIYVVIADGVHDITIKISDEGGGIPRNNLSRIWNYSYSTAAIPGSSSGTDNSGFVIQPESISSEVIVEGDLNQPSVNGWLGPLINAPLAGFGYGLPLSRLYARCFGGDLVIMSMDGFGTDSFLYLSKLGDVDGLDLESS